MSILYAAVFLDFFAIAIHRHARNFKRSPLVFHSRHEHKLDSLVHGRAFHRVMTWDVAIVAPRIGIGAEVEQRADGFLTLFLGGSDGVGREIPGFPALRAALAIDCQREGGAAAVVPRLEVSTCIEQVGHRPCMPGEGGIHEQCAAVAIAWIAVEIRPGLEHHANGTPVAGRGCHVQGGDSPSQATLLEVDIR